MSRLSELIWVEVLWYVNNAFWIPAPSFQICDLEPINSPTHLYYSINNNLRKLWWKGNTAHNPGLAQGRQTVAIGSLLQVLCLFHSAEGSRSQGRCLSCLPLTFPAQSKCQIILFKLLMMNTEKKRQSQKNKGQNNKRSSKEEFFKEAFF